MDEQHPPGQPSEDTAAFVLGALPEAEREAFTRHLEICAVCAEEVNSLGHVVGALASAAPQVDAPAELKDRLMGTVRREAGEQASARSRAGGREPALRRRSTPRRWFQGAGALVAAAVVVVIAVLLAGGGGTTRVLHGRVLIGGASASVRISGGHAQLELTGMPQSPKGRIYELWIKRGGSPQPTDALFDVTSGGRATIAVPGSLRGARELLVTAEPLGGSKVPTRAPIVVAPLT